ncbi:Eco57I restriction-modification methylase domain-containing protein [Candidatus Bipolaricaulota bacterium]
MTSSTTVALSDEVKRQLKTLIVELRSVLEDDLRRELKRLGLDTEAEAPTPANQLTYLSSDEMAVRRSADAALAKQMEAAEGDYPTAVHSLLREATYTHLNRLIGLKCLELRGHLQIEGERTEAVTCRSEYGGRSKWLWTLRERDGRFRFGEQAEETLWLEGLTLAYTAVNEDISLLFDPADPHASVWPSHRVLRTIIDKLSELPEDTYRADELLGWVYQYFQTDEKLKVTSGESFIQKRRKTKKCEGEDIATYTSLYTERYMVDFLLQNSLGRLWMEMYPESAAKDAWPYYVEPATPHGRERKPLKEWKILDPCAGSGHFLVVAFDMLLQLYAEEQRMAGGAAIPEDWAVDAEDVGVTILERNLHGIDIDARAIQLASLALYLKGKEAGLSRLPHMHLVSADASFMSGSAWDEFLESFEKEPSVRRVLEALSRSLEHTSELGTLLRPEKALRRIIAEEHGRWEEQVRRQQEENFLFPEMRSTAEALPFEQITDELFWERLSYRVEAALRGFIDEAREKGELETQVVAGEAHKGFLFMELLEQRYDVVCTNPPYLGSGNLGKVVKDYVGKEYKSGKSDLYAAFILRNRELAIEDGYVAMVTQQSWMFLKSFADLRALDEKKLAKAKRGEFKGLLRETSIETLAHLGASAFGEISGEVVNCALFTLRRSRPIADHHLTAFRLIGPKGPEKKDELLRSTIAGDAEGVAFSPEQKAFLRIPQSPLPYWLSKHVVGLFKLPLLGHTADLVQQVITSDNNRFLRRTWEILEPNTRWRPYAKAGSYMKWAGLESYWLDWDDNGEALKAAILGKYPYLNGNTGWLVKEDTFGRGEATYSKTGRGSLGVRAMDELLLCDSASPVIIPEHPMPGLIAGLNCRLASYLVRSTTAAIEFREGYVGRIPLPPVLPPALESIERTCIDLKGRLVMTDPLERSFHDACWTGCHDSDGCGGQFATCAVLHACEGWSESLVFRAYELGDDDVEQALSETGTPVGWHNTISGYSTLPLLNQPSLPLAAIQDSMVGYISSIDTRHLDSPQLADVKGRLAELYAAGPGANTMQESDETDGVDTEGADAATAVYAPIPTETYLEELAAKLMIHPISVYRLLEELHAQGVVCGAECKRTSEKYLTIKTLRMLGHRWPMQGQYEEERGGPFLDPKWIDADGIIPLVDGTGEETLADRLRRYLDEEYGSEHGPEVEKELALALGWKLGQEWGAQMPMPLNRWFEREFFKRHFSQFKKRPIAWHLTSEKGTFQAIVYYHKLDKNRLQLLRSRYVRQMLERLEKDLGAAKHESMDREVIARVENLEGQVEDIRRFDQKLQQLLEGRDRSARIWCPWKSNDDQPVGWDPDINDGVRLNIAPVQRLELLSASVLSKKDLNSLRAPEGRI